MKNYILQRTKDGLLLICEALDKKGQVVKFVPSGPFDIGNASEGTKALALAIMGHFYGVGPVAKAEAQRQVQPFMDAFLLSHAMPLGAKYEIPDSVIDRFFSLNQLV